MGTLPVRAPCNPQHYKTGYKITSGPQVVRLAAQPRPSRGSPKLQVGGQNHNSPKNGVVRLQNSQCLGTLQCFKAGTKSYLAQKWAFWLRHHYR